MHGNVVRAARRSIAARAITNEALRPHPVDMLHCGRRFQIQYGSNKASAVIRRLGAIGDSEIVRQGFGGQEKGDIMKEGR